MLKIHDCSNSSLRPQHRGNGGPKENDILRYLKEYAHNYFCEFTTLKNCDVVITNDIFTPDVLESSKPKVKRMDGVFSHYELLKRNYEYNTAAQQADHVIFISKFSQDSYFALYGDPLKNYSIILNVADDSIFYPNENNFSSFTWVAQATDWSRPEKRFDTILEFITEILKLYPKDRVNLIGKHPVIEKINNLNSFGYIDNSNEVAKILNSSHAMINLSYKDAAPKVVAQAVSCGLPVLYADSGGVHEMVTSGVPISDSKNFGIDGNIPKLSMFELGIKANMLRNNYFRYKQNNSKKHSFSEMLSKYFETIKLIS